MTARLWNQDEDVARFFATSPAPPPSNRPSQNLPGPSDGSSPYFSRSFNSNVVVAMVVLLLALVVAGFINTVARYVLRRRGLELNPEDQNGGTPKGLDKSVIEALPVVAYGADSAEKNISVVEETSNECVVCLSEFVHGEKLRLLPECHHGFHVGCIDAWLVTHTTCPVCRRGVVSGESEGGAPRAPRVEPGGSARFGSSRFGSARIASVGIEIESSGEAASGSVAPAPADPAGGGAGLSTASRSNRSFRSMVPTEAMEIIIHGVLGHRRFGLRSQARV